MTNRRKSISSPRFLWFSAAAVLVLAMACDGQGESETALAQDAAKSKTEWTIEPQGAAAAKGGDKPAVAQPVYDLKGPIDPLAERLCDALYKVPAERKAECCDTSTRGDLSTFCGQVVSAAMKESVKVDAAGVDACIRDIHAAHQGCDWITPLGQAPPQSCRGLITGAYGVGHGCRSALECDEGLYCQGAGPTQAGVCAQPKKAGEKCGASVDSLAGYAKQVDYVDDHPECEGYCAGRECVDLAPLGGNCRTTKGCEQGKRCLDRKCVAGEVASLGEACSDASCGPDAICVPVDEDKVARPIEWNQRSEAFVGECRTPKAAGEPCTAPFECEASCVMAEGETTGVCGMLCSARISKPPQTRAMPADRAKGAEAG